MPKNKIKHFFILLASSLIICWQFSAPGTFSGHDDLHYLRIAEIKECLADGQIPCRWSKNLGGGLGQPTFNYYSATPYYFGAFISLLGFSVVSSVKIVFFLSVLLGSSFAYLLLNLFFSSTASLIGAVSYAFLPYHLLNLFVRGALAENFALALLPLLLYSIFSFFNKPSKSSSIIFSVSLFLFVCSHNITTIVSLPLILAVVIYSFFRYHPRLKTILNFCFFSLLGIGLSGFYLFPLFFERNLVNTSALNSGYFDFRAHFISLYQLFLSQSWGYVDSVGPNQMSFFLGFQAILGLIMFIPIATKDRQRKSQNLYLAALMVLLYGFYVFLTHNLSTPIYSIFSVLSLMQFPWRALGLAGVCSLFFIAYVSEWILSKSINYRLILILFIVTLIPNLAHLKFEKLFLNLNDQAIFSGKLFDSQKMGGVSDYPPISVKSLPAAVIPDFPEIKDGRATINNFSHRSNYFASDIDIYSDSAQIIFPVSYFPNWEVFADNQVPALPLDYSDRLGRISITLSKGHHQVQSFLSNTPVRNYSNLISVISFIILTIVAFI